MFSPIAIVGRGCVLPGALDPAALWDAVSSGRDLVGPVPEGRWRLDADRALTADPEDSQDRSWTDRGGYVRGFEFDPHGYAVAADQLEGLDVLVQWTLTAGRQALAEAGLTGGSARAGLVLGNLSFPSAEMAAFAEGQWLEGSGLSPGQGDWRNRFHSGLPAHIAAAALGLGAGAFALDAACASSLYALELACRRLQDGSADVMLAGAVQACDDLFIHVGFCALQAMSKTGRSRPFHRDADGLVPGEGAGMVVLMRLADAEAQGHRVLGVIRGVGLSNDGRGRHLLAPSAAGQTRAIAAAYAQSGLTPDDIGLAECHATGTSVGDATELESMASVFGTRTTPVPLGSLKSNMGHLVTTAGVAGLLKVLGAMEHGLMPPTLNADEPLDQAVSAPFRLLTSAEPWTGPRRASVSAFGFGGNNAHIVVEAVSETRARPPAVSPVAPPTGPVAIVAMGARVAAGQGLSDLAAALAQSPLRPEADGRRRARALEAPVQLQGLRTPPKDLHHALGQHLLLLEAAREAVAAGPDLPRERTGAWIGMGCDAEIARYGARWRIPALAETAGEADSDWVREAQAAFVHGLEAAGVVGTMPNIPANRLNGQFDIAGPSHTVSGEELSGVHALEIACRKLRAGELDAAIVGAVDLSCEPVHEAALDAAYGAVPSADAAVVFVLKRLEDVGDAPIWGVLPGPEDPARFGEMRLEQGQSPLTDTLGHAHAASGLLHVAAAALTCAQTGAAGLTLDIVALGGQRAQVRVAHGGTATPAIAPPPTGPSIPFPAHPAPVALPPRARASTGAPMDLGLPSLSSQPVAQVQAGVQHMAPAPALAPVDTRDAVSAPLAQPVPPPIAQPVIHDVAAPATAAAPATQTLTAMHAQLAQLHAGFMAQQAQVHAQFLATRQQATQTLLSAMRGSMAAGTPPSPALQARGTRPVPTVPPALPPTPQPMPPKARPAVRKPRPAPKAPAPRPAPVVAPPQPAKAEPRAVATPPAAAPTTAGIPPCSPSYAPTGTPFYDKAQLAIHSSGKISELYGDMFKGQDHHRIQTRMPEPPLLLSDRLTGIDAVAGSMKNGTLWTETDVTDESWWLHDGRMPAGIMIESGQADLMLISWLGIDLLLDGSRHYRLLGCELTWRGELPKPGDTLCYDIHVLGHAKQGDVRLFFFQYDCRVNGELRLSVRSGQAGFFTREELNNSAGVLWDAETGEHDADARVDPPAVASVRTALSRSQLEAYAAGDAFACFGPGFERTRTHTRTPSISGGRMLFLEEVTHLDHTGGPWGRGYLRAIDPILPDDWFFEGHFKNDPCMPGTLMFEGCLQAMAVYLSSLGFCIERDGWRFEPVQEETYLMRCRGEINPSSKLLEYEVFVEEVHAGPYPTVFADLLCTADGLKAFHCRRMGLRLVPDWPMSTMPVFVHNARQDKGPVASWDGFEFGQHSLYACAWGRPTEAFGPVYERFDSPRSVARLPGPPYHFMSRVVEISGDMASFEAGTEIVVEYDIAPDAWYFRAHGARVMPYPVLLEAALQPCGWLASYLGCALQVDSDLLFRNLDGTATLHRDILPTDGVLTTKVKNTRISRIGTMIIVGFEVRCFVGDEAVWDMDTVFGFFPPEAFEDQAGLPVTDAQREALDADSTGAIDLFSTLPHARSTRLPRRMLRMLDRVTGWWPEGGESGLGRARGEKDVVPGEWMFKAHFFSDPVQPGSLGIEAMVQLLQWVMLERGMDEGLDRPRFECVRTGASHTWKYRGQVVPDNRVVSVTLDITELGTDDRGPYAVAEAALWVDGKHIYDCHDLAMRIVEDTHHAEVSEETISVDSHPHYADHCPTWTRPVMPGMGLVARLAAAGARLLGGVCTGMDDVEIRGWLTLDSPRLLTERIGDDGAVELLCDGKLAARAKVHTAEVWPLGPDPRVALSEGHVVEDPYTAGALFHGPAFQALRTLRLSTHEAETVGASGMLDAKVGDTEAGLVHEILLDAATHVIPHDALHSWSPRVPADQVAYPSRLPTVRFFGPAPTSGAVRVEARFEGFVDDNPRFPRITLQLIDQGSERVWAELELVEATFPKGPIGTASPEDRRAFLTGTHVPGLRLSTTDGETSRLDPRVVRASDWLPGTVAAAFGLPDLPPADLDTVLLAREVAADILGVHPAEVPATEAARLEHIPVDIRRDGLELVATAGSPQLDLAPIQAHWDRFYDIGRWPTEDLYYGLMTRFVNRVHFEDHAAFAAIHGRSAVYLANHQTMIESLMFSIIAGAISGVPTVTLAKMEHQQTWLGKLIAHCFTWPGARDPEVIAFFDRSDKASLPAIIGDLARQMAGPGKSIMVHVEGTRALSCRKPVEKMSGAFIDMALGVNAPIVPVRFTGGLPAEALDARTDFPVGMGSQDIWFGTPLLPEELASEPYGERKKRVIAAINGLGPDNAAEAPHAPDHTFAKAVHDWQSSAGASEAHATLLRVLQAQSAPCAGTARLLEAVDQGVFEAAGSGEDAFLSVLYGWLQGT